MPFWLLGLSHSLVTDPCALPAGSAPQPPSQTTLWTLSTPPPPPQDAPPQDPCLTFVPSATSAPFVPRSPTEHRSLGREGRGVGDSARHSWLLTAHPEVAHLTPRWRPPAPSSVLLGVNVGSPVTADTTSFSTEPSLILLLQSRHPTPAASVREEELTVRAGNLTHRWMAPLTGGRQGIDADGTPLLHPMVGRAWCLVTHHVSVISLLIHLHESGPGSGCCSGAGGVPAQGRRGRARLPPHAPGVGRWWTAGREGLLG